MTATLAKQIGYIDDRNAAPAVFITPTHQRPDGFVDPDDTTLDKARDGVAALQWQHITGKHPIRQTDEE